jgi:hypothetical protein
MRTELPKCQRWLGVNFSLGSKILLKTALRGCALTPDLNSEGRAL